jgi:hypothetical protein
MRTSARREFRSDIFFCVSMPRSPASFIFSVKTPPRLFIPFLNDARVSNTRTIAPSAGPNRGEARDATATDDENSAGGTRVRGGDLAD